MSTEEIYNYRKVNDRTGTAGQPTEEQLRAVAAEGFTTVINLATIDPDRSLADEGGLVRSLGMTYHHIPVAWGDPQESDFTAFEAAMQDSSTDKTLIHCAANFRVTAFYGLYAMKHLGWTEAQADEFRASIWAGSDYPIWEKFIGEMKMKMQNPSRERTLMIDLTSKFGRKVKRHLRQEYVVWLTTSGADLSPQPRPVWFIWDGASFLIFSQPHAHKVQHIAAHPQVALHFNTDATGDKDVIVFVGIAAIDATEPPAHKVRAYLRKYRTGIEELGMTPEQFSREYSVAIRVTPTMLRGW